ncbi:MAG: reverse transcriptase domain-containing protein [Candidatus Omnitrophica bacterium]|nr:reverse transcriptase domain-containing protein [Candidatus Omnitrophota bacterium]
MEELTNKIKWSEVYDEAQLYKAAVRLYTTPVFNWRKALGESFDKRNFYDFARHGLSKLNEIHEKLQKRIFSFRPGISIDFNFNGKHRTVYVYPWEERLVDLLLYRILNQALDKWFSRNSYAYRLKGPGIDTCQRRIELCLKIKQKPVYIIKRDISNYFNSVDHDILSRKLSALVVENDYLFSLMKQRISFSYYKQDNLTVAQKGIPFGTAIACVFANTYLTELDRCLDRIPGLSYFRYSDDFIFFSSDREISLLALERFESFISALRLNDKEAQRFNFVFSQENTADEYFKSVTKFKHLGLEFKADGLTGLSRDKARKIRNIFRYALRRKIGKVRKAKDIDKRIDAAIEIINRVLDNGIRNIAIIDYYLRHVSDEAQIRLIDRWLAEETLSVVLDNGHKKGSFRKISFKKLRERGLPSLAHRRKLILHGHMESSFFVWKNYQVLKAHKGTAVRCPVSIDKGAFSPLPGAAVVNPREREVLSVDGRY